VKQEDIFQPEFSADSSSPAVAEATDKRQYPRVPVSIGAEIVEARTRALITGRATDFGVGGCYVDTMKTFAKGTPVEVALHRQGRTLRVHALVSYAVHDRNIGMGLSFTAMSAEAGATLLDWVTGLTSEPAQKPAPRHLRPTAAGSEAQLTREQGLERVIGELVALLVRKQLLTDSEAAPLRANLSK
jgi:hypothetical protein